MSEKGEKRLLYAPLETLSDRDREERRVLKRAMGILSGVGPGMTAGMIFDVLFHTAPLGTIGGTVAGGYLGNKISRINKKIRAWQDS
ncbi:MAG TPA: hypothetical protein VI957_00645 [Candidatus Paceibacterota bacterium]